MVGLWLMVLNLAQAATHSIGMSVDGHRSIGLSTRLKLTGIGGSLQILRKGNGPHGVLLEVQDLMEWSPSGLSHLPGGRLGWYREGRTLSADTQIYSLVGLGAYANEVLPILPIIWGESGIQWQGERTEIRVGPQIMALPPFFIGGGLRVTLSFTGWVAE